MRGSRPTRRALGRRRTSRAGLRHRSITPGDAEPTPSPFSSRSIRVNFGSGYFPHLRKRPGMSGYYTVAPSLKSAGTQDGPLTGDRAAHVCAQDAARVIFGQDRRTRPGAGADGALRAGTERSRASGSGDAMTTIRMAPVEDAERLGGAVGRSSSPRCPSIGMSRSYRGREVPLYKRAQILVSDLAIAFDERGPGRVPRSRPADHLRRQPGAARAARRWRARLRPRSPGAHRAGD